MKKSYIVLVCALTTAVLGTSIGLSSAALAFSANNKKTVVEGLKGDTGETGPKGDNGLTAYSNTLLPTQNGKIIPNVGSAIVGSEIVFTFIPDDGARLVSIDVYKNNQLKTYYNGFDKEIVNNTLTLPMIEGGYVIGATFDNSESKIFNGGNGTIEHPYLVGSEDFSSIYKYANSSTYKDIYTYYKIEEANVKITNWRMFALHGSFDFNGASIDNNKNFIFSSIRGTLDNPGKVSNLTINNSSISTSGFGGSLAFNPDGSVIVENVHINGGSVTGEWGAGSFFGMIQKSDHMDLNGKNEIKFINSTSSLNITGGLNQISGFVGPFRIYDGFGEGFKIEISVDKDSKYTGKLSVVNSNASDIKTKADYVIADDWPDKVYKYCTVNVEDVNKLADVTSSSYSDTYTIYTYKNTLSLTKEEIYNTADGKKDSAYKTDVNTFKIAKVDNAVKASISMSIGVTDANLVYAIPLEELTSTTKDGEKEYFVTSKAKSYKIGINGHFYDQTGAKITTSTPKWDLEELQDSINYKISGEYLMVQTSKSVESGINSHKFGLYGAKTLITQYDKNNNIVGQTSVYFAHQSTFEENK